MNCKTCEAENRDMCICGNGIINNMKKAIERIDKQKPEKFRPIIAPRLFNWGVNDGAIESEYFISVDINEEKDLIIEKLKIATDALEFYASDFNQINPRQARKALIKIKDEK